MEADRALHARQQYEREGFYLAAQPLIPQDVLAAAVAGMDAVKIGDVAADSGPMRFVRRSHRWGFLDQGDFFGSDQEALKAGIQMPGGESWEEVDALLPAGGVSFHHCLTYHASDANISDVPRCSVAVHLRTQEAEPVSGDTSYYISHLHDAAQCPVIYRG